MFADPDCLYVLLFSFGVILVEEDLLIVVVSLVIDW